MDALPSSPNINKPHFILGVGEFEALLPQILKISDPISALLAELWSRFTSQDSEFQEDKTELNLEVFIILQKFEDENIQHIL